MSTLRLPDRKHTHLQRAYRIFERMQPQLISARTLAALMITEIPSAYNYIKRLKALGCIEQKGGTGRVPLYGLVNNATMPAGDTRGRKRRIIDRVLEPIVSGGSYELEIEPAAMAASGTGQS
jgi:hypothetical protein